MPLVLGGSLGVAALYDVRLRRVPLALTVVAVVASFWFYPWAAASGLVAGTIIAWWCKAGASDALWCAVVAALVGPPAVLIAFVGAMILARRAISVPFVTVLAAAALAWFVVARCG